MYVWSEEKNESKDEYLRVYKRINNKKGKRFMEIFEMKFDESLVAAEGRECIPPFEFKNPFLDGKDGICELKQDYCRNDYPNDTIPAKPIQPSYSYRR